MTRGQTSGDVEASGESSFTQVRDGTIPLAFVLGGLFALAAAVQTFVLLEVAAARGADPTTTVLQLGTPTIGLLAAGFGVGFAYLRQRLTASPESITEDREP